MRDASVCLSWCQAQTHARREHFLDDKHVPLLLTILALTLSDLYVGAHTQMHTHALMIHWWGVQPASNQPMPRPSKRSRTGAPLQPHFHAALRQGVLAVLPRPDSVRRVAPRALLRQRLCRIQATRPDKDPVHTVRGQEHWSSLRSASSSRRPAAAALVEREKSSSRLYSEPRLWLCMLATRRQG